jgi:hypothetical protein
MALQNLGVDPLKIALPWIMQAFAGFLPVEQVADILYHYINSTIVDLVPIYAASLCWSYHLLP